MSTAVHSVQFTFEGQAGFSMECREDEDLVTAALRQGYILFTECREGVCATCKGLLADGEYDELLAHSVHALSPEEEEEGYILACRLRPRSDLLVEYDYPFERVERFAAGARRGQIVALDRLSETVARVVVRTLSAQPPLGYEPGQHVRLTLAATGVSRDFSMAGVCSESRELEFLVRILADGAFSGHIARRAQVGDLLTVEGPYGGFVLRPSPLTPVFVAGGTGLAPIMAMLRSLAVERPGQPALLFFGNTGSQDVFFDEELERLIAALPGLRVHRSLVHPAPGWRGDVGVVTDAMAAQLVDPAAHTFYLCGPPPMIQAARALLAGWGVDRRRVFAESFIPSGGS